jgi:hypothetical protein
MSQVLASLNSTKELVIHYLKADPRYRDNDEMLVARFWNNEVEAKKLNTTMLSGWDFLVMYAKGKITSADIITRARRKAQEENPELRGTKWNERHKDADDVRNNINQP